MKSTLVIADDFLSKWDNKTCHPRALAKVLDQVKREVLQEVIEEIRLLMVPKRKRRLQPLKNPEKWECVHGITGCCEERP